METQYDSGPVAGGVIAAKLDALAGLLKQQAPARVEAFRVDLEAKSMELGEQLREAVEASGRTAYSIAQEAGIRPEMLTRFLAGQRDLTLASAGKVAAALQLELRRRNAKANKRS